MPRNRDVEPGSSDTRDRRKMLWCKHCRQEFLTYRMTGESNCPDCRRPCGSPPPRSAHVEDADMSEHGGDSRGAKVVRIVLALLLLGGLAFSAWAIYKDPEAVRAWRDRFLTPSSNAPDANAPAGNELTEVAPDTAAAPSDRPTDVAPDSPAGDLPPTP